MQSRSHDRAPIGTGEEPPILWRVHGYYAGLDWDAAENRYTASVPRIPGVAGRGRDRTEALRALERELAELLD